MNCVSQDQAYSRLKDHLIALTGLAFYANRDKLLTDVIGAVCESLPLPAIAPRVLELVSCKNS